MAFARLSTVAVLLAATTLVAVGAPATAAPTAAVAPPVAASSRSLSAPSGGSGGLVPETQRTVRRRQVVWVRQNGQQRVVQVWGSPQKRVVVVQQPPRQGRPSQTVVLPGSGSSTLPSGSTWQVVTDSNGQVFLVSIPGSAAPPAQQVVVQQPQQPAPPAQQVVVQQPQQPAPPAQQVVVQQPQQPAPPAQQVVVQQPQQPAPPAQQVVVQQPPPAAVAPSGGNLGRQLESLLNEERARNGRSRLGTRGDLQANAEGHATAMANRGRIYHQSMGPLLAAWGASWVSENVASNSVSAGASGLVQQWMNSPGHRDNLLSTRATITGCGVATRNGQNYASCEYAAV